MKDPARRFFLISIAYALFSVIWFVVFLESPLEFVKVNIEHVTIFLSMLVSSKILLLIGIGILLIAYRRLPFWLLMRSALFTTLGIGIFTGSFTSIKSTFPNIMPFFADDFFSKIDRAIFFGNDAWLVLHRLIPNIPPQTIDLIYLNIWVPVTFFFPLVLTLIERDRACINRFFVLYIFVFLVLGNFAALAGLSVGPVFYDGYYGEQAYSNLSGALELSGVTDSRIGAIQRGLWEMLSQVSQKLSSGVSAFPSIHIASVALVALYAFERSKILGSILALYTGTVFFLSIYTGYHYAIDGVVSILAVLGVWAVLRRPQINEFLNWV